MIPNETPHRGNLIDALIRKTGRPDGKTYKLSMAESQSHRAMETMIDHAHSLWTLLTRPWLCRLAILTTMQFFNLISECL